MPAYETFVTNMTANSKKNREAGLGSLCTMFELLTKQQQLAVAEEPGLLDALELFLRGDKADIALDLLIELGELEYDEGTETSEKCGRCHLLLALLLHRQRIGGDGQHRGAQEEGLESRRGRVLHGE